MSPASIAIVVFFVLGIFGINRARRRPAWKLTGDPLPEPQEGPNRFRKSATKIALLWFAVASIVTLIAGVLLEQTGNELANDWGINGAVFGATILAAVTALPEISSGIEAVRLGDVGLAMSDIYGGNAVQLTLFLLADLLAGEPVLPTASAQALWLGAVGAVMTGIFAYGLLLRPTTKAVVDRARLGGRARNIRRRGALLTRDTRVTTRSPRRGSASSQSPTLLPSLPSRRPSARSTPRGRARSALRPASSRARSRIPRRS